MIEIQMNISWKYQTNKRKLIKNVFFWPILLKKKGKWVTITHSIGISRKYEILLEMLFVISVNQSN